jgi:ribose transport system permease protein
MNAIRGRIRSLGPVVALVVLVAIVEIAQPGFLAYGNLMNVVSQWAPVVIMGIGMTYVVITGGFDLSIGAVYALSAVTAAALGRTQPPIIAFTIAILVGLLVGVLNGFIVTVLRVNAFIATLGSSLLVSGATLVLTNNSAFIVDFPPFAVLGQGRLAGFPYSGLLMIALLLVSGAVLAWTPYGQSVYAVGGNSEASRLAGLRTLLITGSAYALAGLSAGIGGVITASQLASAQANLSPNLVFDVLTIVIIGGTSLAGGRGAIWRTVVGAAILATLQNGFNLLDINANYQDIIKGVIIIAAVASVPAVRIRLRLPRSRHTTEPAQELTTTASTLKATPQQETTTEGEPQ